MVRDSPGSGSAGTTGSGRGAKPRVGWSGHRSCRLDAGERDERRGGFECEARSAAAAAAVVVVLKWVGERWLRTMTRPAGVPGRQRAGDHDGDEKRRRRRARDRRGGGATGCGVVGVAGVGSEA